MSLPPSIRSSLVGRLASADAQQPLQVFLSLFNRRVPGCCVLLSQCGKGSVVFNLQTRNHYMRTISQFRGLLQIVNSHFRRNPDHSEMVRLTGKVAVIHKYIMINGKKWNCESQCEYIGREGDRMSLQVGSVMAFLVVGFTVGGAANNMDVETTVFVHLKKMSRGSLRSVGPPGCGHYRVHLRSCIVQDEYVHVQALAKLLCPVPDNRGRDGVALSSIEGSENDGAWTYLVPVAKAFED